MQIHTSLFTRGAIAATLLAMAPIATVHAQRAAAGTAAGTAAPSPGPDIYLVPLSSAGGVVKVGVPVNLTRRDGYDNQPAFSGNSRELYYTSNRGDGQSDIYRYDFNTGLSVPARHTTPESEYSAFPIDGGKALGVIRVEADSTQRLWRMPLDGSDATVVFPDIKPVGYFAQADDSTIAMFVLGSPATLQVGIIGKPGSTVIARNIGRSLHRIPGSKNVSYVQKGGDAWYVMRLDPTSRKVDTLIRTLPRSEDMAWIDSTTIVMGQGTKLFVWTMGAADWTQVADFAFAHLTGISRLAVSPNRQSLAMVADVVPRSAVVPREVFVDKFDANVIKKGVEILAADSMEGRRTGSRGGEKAAKWIAAQYKAAGLVPAGDSGGFEQYLPLQIMSSPQQAMPGSGAPPPMPSQPRLGAVDSWTQWEQLEPAKRLKSSNVIGVLPGSDPALRDEVVLVTAHYDHIGFGRPVDGDSINNGADDDASGVIATIEIAKALRNGPRPKRTIVFMAITGEEVGGFGTRWYIAHPVRPLDKTVVDLNIEMIANADSLAGGFGKAWLTGYERSTMGDMLADNGIPLVLDPRPTQRFFERSDNVAFARIGIPAHSLSSFNLQTPYHHPKDEPSIINAPHMAAVIGATSKALRLLADGPRPTWHPGGQPEQRNR